MMTKPIRDKPEPNKAQNFIRTHYSNIPLFPPGHRPNRPEANWGEAPEFVFLKYINFSSLIQHCPDEGVSICKKRKGIEGRWYNNYTETCSAGNSKIEPMPDRNVDVHGLSNFIYCARRCWQPWISYNICLILGDKGIMLQKIHDLGINNPFHHNSSLRPVGSLLIRVI